MAQVKVVKWEFDEDDEGFYGSDEEEYNDNIGGDFEDYEDEGEGGGNFCEDREFQVIEDHLNVKQRHARFIALKQREEQKLPKRSWPFLKFSPTIKIQSKLAKSFDLEDNLWNIIDERKAGLRQIQFKKRKDTSWFMYATDDIINLRMPGSRYFVKHFLAIRDVMDSRTGVKNTEFQWLNEVKTSLHVWFWHRRHQEYVAMEKYGDVVFVYVEEELESWRQEQKRKKTLRNKQMKRHTMGKKKRPNSKNKRKNNEKGDDEEHYEEAVQENLDDRRKIEDLVVFAAGNKSSVAGEKANIDDIYSLKKINEQLLLPINRLSI
jgi:hypothetical protein